ncbi:MAG: extracellular solute-binding protein [Devosia sp.]
MKLRRSILLGAAAMALGGTLLALPAISQDGSNKLTIMTNSGSWLGLTEDSLNSTSSVSSFYRYFGDLWAEKFPGLEVEEIQVKDMSEATSKTLLAVQSRNPVDIIPVGGDLGALVERGALENLDDLYAAAGITEADFLPGVAESARYNGHWYGIPGASDPSVGDLFYIAETLVELGLDPDNPPTTWDELYALIEQTTEFDANGKIVRAGFMLDYRPQQLSDVINVYCGRWETYDPATAQFRADSPCIQGYFNFQKKVLEFYGGIENWKEFALGDPYVWDCADNEYAQSGKTVFAIDAWWVGNQMDMCPNYLKEWRLAPAPVAPSGNEYGVNAVRTQAWMVAIPKGAKNKQLAFDFARFTLWDNGGLLGPTTNGAVLKNQLAPWAATLIATSDAAREAKGAAGKPMAGALEVVLAEAEGSLVGTPSSPHTTYYNTLMDQAWQDIQYGNATVEEALANAQQLIDKRVNG